MNNGRDCVRCPKCESAQFLDSGTCSECGTVLLPEKPEPERRKYDPSIYVHKPKPPKPAASRADYIALYRSLVKRGVLIPDPALDKDGAA